MKKQKKPRAQNLPAKVIKPAVPTPVGNVPPGSTVNVLVIYGDVNAPVTIGFPQKEVKGFALVEKAVHLIRRLWMSFTAVGPLLIAHSCQ